jgi:hypothetical protein
MDTRTSPIRLRITQLREVLAREGVFALLVPSADPTEALLQLHAELAEFDHLVGDQFRVAVVAPAAASAQKDDDAKPAAAASDR